MNIDEAFSRAMKLCSVKEYSPHEIEIKLSGWGLTDDDINIIIERLKEDKFLDEFRMARYFANDRLKFYKWGKAKIKYMLQQKKINNEAIKSALNQINEEEYI
jgi:regulatory protein